LRNKGLPEVVAEMLCVGKTDQSILYFDLQFFIEEVGASS
jgi:hypothetical protein